MIKCRITTKLGQYIFENGAVLFQYKPAGETLEVYVRVEIVKSYSFNTGEFDHKIERYHFTFNKNDIKEVYFNGKNINLKKLFKENSYGRY